MKSQLKLDLPDARQEICRHRLSCGQLCEGALGHGGDHWCWVLVKEPRPAPLRRGGRQEGPSLSDRRRRWP